MANKLLLGILTCFSSLLFYKSSQYHIYDSYLIEMKITYLADRSTELLAVFVCRVFRFCVGTLTVYINGQLCEISLTISG